MRTGRQVHRFIIRLHSFRQRHGGERRIVASARDSRAVRGDLPLLRTGRSQKPPARRASRVRSPANRRAAALPLATSPRGDAQRNNSSAPSSANVRSSSFVNGNPPLEILQRTKLPLPALPQRALRHAPAASHSPRKTPAARYHPTRPCSAIPIPPRKPAASRTPCRCASFTIVAGE